MGLKGGAFTPIFSMLFDDEIVLQIRSEKVKVEHKYWYGPPLYHHGEYCWRRISHITDERGRKVCLFLFVRLAFES